LITLLKRRVFLLFDTMVVQHFVKCEGSTYCMENLQTAAQAVEKVKFLLGLPDEIPWRAEQNGRFLPLDSPLAPEPLLLLPNPGLRGGKGGFGSLLRAIGAQIEATTNHEAMRDLTGRRQRDVNNERRLKEYVDGAAERERLEQEKKEAKLEKLRKVAEGQLHNRDKHTFSDPQYDKARSEVEEKIHDAVEAAMAAGGEKSIAGGSSSKDLKRKGSEAGSGSEVKKAKGMFMMGGLEGLEDEDLTDSSDEEEEGEKTKTLAVK